MSEQAAYTEIGECFSCALPLYSYMQAYVLATPWGLVRVCRVHAQKNSLAREMRAGDVVVGNSDIKGWKRG